MSETGFGASKEQLNSAYDEVMRQVYGDAALQARCEAVRPLVVQRIYNPQAAAKTLQVALGKGWNWLAWEDFADADGRDSLKSIDEYYEQIDMDELFKKATKEELCDALLMEDIAFKRSQSKAQLAALLKPLGRSGVMQALSSVVDRLREADERKCREQMALFMVTRMTAIAHHTMRYAQLDDLADVRPRWRFVCDGQPMGHCCAKGVRGKTLPASEAKRVFPRLPCEWLTCRGHVVAVQ